MEPIYVESISLTHGSNPRQHHQVLLGMTTSVTLAVQSIFNTFSMVMIHYGMEQVVDKITTVVT